jgi:two-component system response regulator AtoC
MGIPRKVLIVDDEPEALENCRRILNRLEYECFTERDPVRALDLLERERPRLVLTDLCMPGLDGIGLLDAAKRLDPEVHVVLLTAYATVQTAVTAMRQGAADYLTKPFTSAELEQVVRRAFDAVPSFGTMQGGDRTVDLSRRPEPDAVTTWPSRTGILGKSPEMQDVLALVARIAPTSANVLVCGESGTGKELIARAIHAQSRRGDGPFVPVDCVSLPDTLLESELFGHEKGAFTGAYSSKPGLFELAHGGTVFLDEVSAMSPMLQSRLLRVIQERQVRPLGGTRFLDIDVRVVAASNHDLAEACRRGEFRHDLYYRLNVIQIQLPPLRERAGDVTLLAESFLKNYADRDPAHSTKRFSTETLDLLRRYHWPGNVRELHNVVERAAALAAEDVIAPDHLPDELSGGHLDDADATRYKEAKQAVVRSFERQFLADLLKRNHGHMGRAAREAGVDRKTIERMVKRHSLRGLR